MKTWTCLIGLAMVASVAGAAEIVPFDSPRWQIEAAESRIEEFDGKTSLVMRGGIAVIADADFLDGVIEYQCSFPAGRAFIGATWRVQDAANREEFYIRSHQSGNPDANQYTPVFNGLTGWQLYHGEGYGAPIEYDFDTWIPVRIVVAGDQAEIYIGDLEHPALFVDDLKREPVSGGVGLSIANFGAARYADFRYQKLTAPKLKGRVERQRTGPEGTIRTWQVSSTFSEESFTESTAMPPVDDLSWEPLATEPSGLANISRLRTLSREQNTAYARFTVVSDRDQARTLAIGYSDRLRLYLNGQLLYTGNNGYRTRDYRYLGTIGYFDAVTLPLTRGTNEIRLAVSESFGGWGVQAAFENTDGITIAE